MDFALTADQESIPRRRVMSLDLNPVLLDSPGKGCIVVDAAVFKE